MPTLSDISLNISAAASVVATDGMGRTFNTPQAFSIQVGLATGTAAQQANLVYPVQKVIAASGTSNIDLYGVISDLLGQAFDLVKLKAIIIANYSHLQATPTDAAGTATGAFIDDIFGPVGVSVPIQKKGFWMHAFPEGGIAVTPTTGDIITLTETGGAEQAEFRAWLLGTNA